MTAPMTGAGRRVLATAADLGSLRSLVEAVPDPELPVLTLGQLGVIRSVRAAEKPSVTTDPQVAIVEITPTYSGCPAMEVIAGDVAAAVRAAGWEPEVRLVLSPPWTTDWITEDGRIALQEAGIAPPAHHARGRVALRIGSRPRPEGGTVDRVAARPACPLCGSAEVEELARFGSTACKALWRCLACREPFDYVKPL